MKKGFRLSQDPRAQDAGTGLNPACESRLSYFQKVCGSVVKESLKMKSVVLEKTLESPLDSKEIKPVNPKGNQP